MIGHSGLMRTILLLMVVRGVIDRVTLDNVIAEVLGGIKHGYAERYIADADRYVRDMLARLQQQPEAIERLARENERPQ